MATYPYSSGQKAVFEAVSQLRKGFPGTVDAGWLQRFQIAPANESYIISILRFLGLIGEDGSRAEDNTGYFFGDDPAFRAGLEQTLRKCYVQLFDEMGDGVWDADRGALVAWFRAADKTSDLVGGRQASTFQSLAALAGHGEVSATAPKKAAAAKSSPRASATKATEATTTRKDAKDAQPTQPGQTNPTTVQRSDVGLTVRIEVNLPPGGDAQTYDAIFASIRKHLMP